MIAIDAEVGQVVNRVIPLRNAGTIPLDVSVKVIMHEEQFTVVPMQLTIEPGAQSEVILRFHPQTDETNIER